MNVGLDDSLTPRTLGHSGLRVHPLALSTEHWNITTVHDHQCLLNDFVTSGGNLVLVPPTPGHAARQALGAVLAHGETPAARSLRSHIVLSVSSGVDIDQPLGRRVNLSRRELLHDLDQLLDELGTDYLDIWTLAFFDPLTPLSEVADAVDYAVRSGRVRYAGLRSHSGWQSAVVHSAFASLGAAHHSPIVAEADYNLLDRRVENEVLPALDYLGMGFIATSAVAHGLLLGEPTPGIWDEPFGASYSDEKAPAIIGAVAMAARGLNLTSGVTSIRWLLEKNMVSAVALSLQTSHEWSEYAEMSWEPLPSAIVEALDEVSS